MTARRAVVLPRRARRRLAFILPLFLPVVLLAGCASGGGPVNAARVRLAQELREREITPETIVVPFELDEAARTWLAESVPQRGTPRRRLQSLLDRMVGEDGLGIRYLRTGTGTAPEVFARREANCLGFMNLFVAFAREMGLAAYFVAVEEVESYGREGDLVVIFDHVAAGFGPRERMLLLDFTAGPDIEYESVHRISDLSAVAKYYSNRGTELLVEDDPADALTWLKTAVDLDPNLAPSWVNLGVARRRSGDLTGAEHAYRRALEADPRTPSAYQNLAALLRLRGEEQEAYELLSLTARIGSKNPYNYLNLGDWSREYGRLDDARRFYRRALVLAADDAEPYAALGELEAESGHLARARRWLRKARARDPANPRTAALAEKLTGDGAR